MALSSGIGTLAEEIQTSGAIWSIHDVMGIGSIGASGGECIWVDM